MLPLLLLRDFGLSVRSSHRCQHKHNAREHIKQSFNDADQCRIFCFHRFIFIWVVITVVDVAEDLCHVFDSEKKLWIQMSFCAAIVSTVRFYRVMNLFIFVLGQTSVNSSTVTCGTCALRTLRTINSNQFSVIYLPATGCWRHIPV